MDRWSAFAVVVADGSDHDAVLAPVLGVPVLVRSVRGLLASGVVGEVAVVVHPKVCEAAAELLGGLPVGVHADPANAVAAVRRARVRSTAVLLHDAARALAPPALAEAVTRAVHGSSADGGRRVAVPVLALADTVKRVSPDGLVSGGPDRATLRVVQTPQAFAPGAMSDDLLHRLLVDGPVEHAWAAVDVPVVTVPGHPLAFAVRSAWDRELAETLASETLADEPVRSRP